MLPPNHFNKLFFLTSDTRSASSVSLAGSHLHLPKYKPYSCHSDDGLGEKEYVSVDYELDMKKMDSTQSDIKVLKNDPGVIPDKSDSNFSPSYEENKKNEEDIDDYDDEATPEATTCSVQEEEYVDDVEVFTRIDSNIDVIYREGNKAYDESVASVDEEVEFSSHMQN